MSENTMIVHSLFRDYEVAFADDVGPALRSRLPNSIVVIDRVVADRHGRRLNALIDPERTIMMDATEENKTLDGCRRIIDDLVRRRFRRDQTVIAIGGGIIQDITAFSASIIYRGVEWIFVPTTLLAQADSCLGSKTSINFADNKNLIGNFYPPSRVLIDTGFLDTLSVEDVKSGIGEILHFYYYADSPSISQLMAEYDLLLTERHRFRPYIEESLRIKRAVAERDEFDRGERNKFNYGHTFGHALESATGFAVPHGLAVTVGMDLANYVSVCTGRMQIETFNAAHSILRRNFPSDDLSKIDRDRYVAALAKDKKNVGADLVCILAERPGKLEKVRVPIDAGFQRMVAHYFSGRVWNEAVLTNSAAAMDTTRV